MEIQQELGKLGWEESAVFNKKFSKTEVDIHGILKNFNIEESTLQRITLSAA